ncbi:MAG: hypothetical protein WA091_02305 [Minisyncoccales bacterium]
MEKDETFLFLMRILILCIGNRTNLLNKDHFKIIPVDGKFIYIVGTEKKDLDAFLVLEDKDKRRFVEWRETSVVIKAENICKCMKILLWHLRSGKIYKNKMGFDCTPYLDEKVFETASTTAMSFKNWPVIIKEVIQFTDCTCLNKKYKDKGLLVCGETNKAHKITEAHLCPLIYHNSALDDGECAVSAYIFNQVVVTTEEQQTELNGQQFIIKKIV